MRKNDRRLVTAGAIVPVTIIAAPRHDKPWQALVGARLVTDKMVLLVGEVDKESAVQLSSKISGNQRQQLTERLMAEIDRYPLLWYHSEAKWGWFVRFWGRSNCSFKNVASGHQNSGKGQAGAYF